MSRNFEVLQRAAIERNQGVLHDVTIESTAAPAALPMTPLTAIPCDARSRISSDSVGAEVFDLVQRLFLLPNEWTPRCVVFFSLGAKSDSASVCALAGEALSLHSNGTVCLVDANFNSPTMHDLYCIENSAGFSDALVGPEPLENYAHQVEDRKLTLISAGNNLLGWKSALVSEKARRRVAELRSRFDYVLIEAPANSTISSSVILGQLADGAVVVVEANETRREVVRNAVDELSAANVRVLGAVLNNRRFPIPEKLYRMF